MISSVLVIPAYCDTSSLPSSQQLVGGAHGLFSPTCSVVVIPGKQGYGPSMLPESLWTNQHCDFLKELPYLEKQIPLSFAMFGQLEFNGFLWSGKLALVKVFLSSPVTLAERVVLQIALSNRSHPCCVSKDRRGIKEPDKTSLWFKVLESPENLAMIQSLEWLLSLLLEWKA